jgi:undecaprenyl diphosphate synthase
MSQNTSGFESFVPAFHVAIIMDGNGRWASSRGLPRTAGHREGAVAVRSVVEAAPDLGIGTLTLYAFSSDNWQRPPGEVSGLMQLFRTFLRREAASCRNRGIRIRVIGRRDRLSVPLAREIEGAEEATRSCRRLVLRIAVDYSARDAIVDAACRAAANGGPSRAAIARALDRGEPGPDVDLLIRTGGEQRLSDFLLWESAYAELVFTPMLWPDYRGSDLAAAVEEFRTRDRRFGRIPDPSPAVEGQRALR